MGKKSSSKRSSVPKVDPYLDGFMGKLMDRLTSLERKMDTVIAHTTASRASHPAPQAPRPAVRQQVFSSPHPMVEPKNLPRHERRTMYEAVCADCKDACEVPFRPSPERAIYCKPCFAKRRAEGRLQPPSRPQGPAPAPNALSGPAASAPPAARASASAPAAASGAQSGSAPAKTSKSVKSSRPVKSARPAAKPAAKGKKKK